MRPLIIFSIILLLASACKKKGSGAIDHSSLKGDWRWKQELRTELLNGPAYDTLTPSSTSSTRILHINNDSTYTYQRTGLPDETGRIIIHVLNLPSGQTMQTLDFSHNGKDSMINAGYFIRNDSLYCSSVLTATVVSSVYVRIVPM